MKKDRNKPGGGKNGRVFTPGTIAWIVSGFLLATLFGALVPMLLAVWERRHDEASGEIRVASGGDAGAQRTRRNDGARGDSPRSDVGGRGDRGGRTAAVSDSPPAIGAAGAPDPQTSEIVIANGDAGVRDFAQRNGMILLEERPLPRLGLTVSRYRVSPPATPGSASALLSRTFPNLIVAGNDTYRTEQQAGAKGTSVAHGLVGWTQALGSCTPRLRLGMIDTAVDKSAPGLADSRIVAWHYRPPSAASGGSTHGTKVAHLFVGRSDRLFEGGVVPGATLYAASVEDRSAAPSVTVAGIVAGIDWLLGEDVGVVNVSLAGTDNRLLSLAVRQALGQGMVFVAAAGNNGPSGQPAFPAAYSGVIAATAIDGRMRLYGSANRGPYVAFAAPGVDLWVTGKDRQPELVSGTSFAAPFVAAAAALYRTSKNMTAAEVSAAMAKTAKPLGSGGRNPEFGWGVVQFPVACRPVTSASG